MLRRIVCLGSPVPHGEVLLEVHEPGLDGFHFGVLDLLDEGAHLVAVGRDGGDLGLLDLLDVGVLGLTLEHGDVVVLQVALGETDEVFLGEGCDAVDALHGVLPLDAVDEGVLEHRCASAVVLQLTHLVELHIVDDGRQEVVGEVAALEFLDFREQQVAGFFQRLPGTRIAGHEEQAVVCQLVVAGAGSEHEHLLVDVEVQKSGSSVAEHLAEQRQGVAGAVLGSGELPADVEVLGLQTHHGGVHGLGDGCHGGIFGLVAIGIGLPVAEVFFQDGDGLLRVEVAGHADGDVVRAVVVLEVVLDVRDAGVLQVVLRADGGLRAVGVGGEELVEQCVDHLLAVLAEVQVVLLIDGFQLRVESSDDHVLEAVGLDACPVLHLVGGDVLYVAGDVEAGEGVGAVRTDEGHQLVVLVGDVVLGSELADAVNLVVGLLAGCGVRQLAVGLEALFDLIEQGSLGGAVAGAELLGTLEHQVFQVVGQTRGLGRIVARTGLHGDVCLDARFVLVDGEEDLQAVLQRVDTGLHGVALHGFIVLLVAAI